MSGFKAGCIVLGDHAAALLFPDGPEAKLARLRRRLPWVAAAAFVVGIGLGVAGVLVIGGNP